MVTTEPKGRRRFRYVTVALIFLAGGTTAHPQSLNPHYKRKHKKPAQSAPQGQPGSSSRLAAGSWDPAVKSSIEDFIAHWGKSSSFYDPQKPPIAVVVWDNVAVNGDAGKVVFNQLVSSAEFKFSDDFWEMIPVDFGRQKIRAAHEQFSDLPVSVWGDEPTYRQFENDFPQSYADLCSQINLKACRVYLTRLFNGFTAEEARQYARKVLESAPPDRYKVIPEMKDLVSLLLKNGFDVWACGADAQPVLEAAAPAYGIDVSRAIGIRQHASAKRFNGDVLLPVTVGEGKAAAVALKIGRPPLLVVGGSADDMGLLDFGRGLRVVIDHGDQTIKKAAQKQGWLIQPAL